MPNATLSILLRARDQASRPVGNVARGLSGLTKFAVPAAAAIGAIAVGAVAMGKSLIDSAVAISRVAQASASSAAEISQLEYAFQSVGLELDDVGDVLNSLAIEGIPSIDAFADTLAGIEDPAERAAVASKALGEDVARRVLPLLAQGSEGLQHFRDEADRLGITLSDDVAAGAQDVAASLNRLQARFQGIGRRLLPHIVEFAEGFITHLENAFEIGELLFNNFGEVAPVLLAAAGAKIEIVLNDMRFGLVQGFIHMMAASARVMGEGAERIRQVFENPLRALPYIVDDIAASVLTSLSSIATAIDTISGSNLAGGLNAQLSAIEARRSQRQPFFDETRATNAGIGSSNDVLTALNPILTLINDNGQALRERFDAYQNQLQFLHQQYAEAGEGAGGFAGSAAVSATNRVAETLESFRGSSGGITIDGQSLLEASANTPMHVIIQGYGGGGENRAVTRFAQTQDSIINIDALNELIGGSLARGLL